MIEIFSFTPWIISFAIALVQTLMILGYIWFPKDYRPDSGVKKVFYVIFGGIFKGVFGYFGILMVDTSIIWCLGQFGFEYWNYMLPNVILGILYGTYYVIRVFFSKPNVIQLGYFIISAGFLLYRIHIVIAEAPSMRRSLIAVIDVFITLIVILILMEVVVTWLNERFQNKGKWKIAYAPLWDLTPRLNAVFSRKTNLVLWVFSVIQALCVFYGTSILIF
jgi:hypothetical protein